jgi:hypothetical protein
MKQFPEQYYAFSRNRYSGQWVMVCEFRTKRQAEMIMNTVLLKYSRRYKDEDVKIMSSTEASREFGEGWRNRIRTRKL